jgi:8-oxo-dGTP diphosphatase
MKERSAVIILSPQREVLLIHRLKRGQEYYTLPGGKIDKGESPEHAAIREAHEETSLMVSLRQKLHVLDNEGRIEHYFLVGEYWGDKVALNGPERYYQSATNQYALEWVPVANIGAYPLLPVAARAMVVEGLEILDPSQ